MEPSVTQSPPLINHDDHKVGNHILHHDKVHEKGVEDNNSNEVKSKKNNNNNNNKNGKSMCIIDVKNDDDGDDIVISEEEKLCRICQLSCDNVHEGAGNVNLVLLGCGCRGDLGLSHYHCAFRWFQQKGNRTCEICGKAAKNIKGIEDTGFRAYGIDNGVLLSSTEIMRMSSVVVAHETTEHRCTKSLCNILLAAIVLAFLLPWALHPNKLL